MVFQIIYLQQGFLNPPYILPDCISGPVWLAEQTWIGERESEIWSQYSVSALYRTTVPVPVPALAPYRQNQHGGSVEAQTISTNQHGAAGRTEGKGPIWLAAKPQTSACYNKSRLFNNVSNLTLTPLTLIEHFRLWDVWGTSKIRGGKAWLSSILIVFFFFFFWRCKVHNLSEYLNSRRYWCLMTSHRTLYSCTSAERVRGWGSSPH